MAKDVLRIEIMEALISKFEKLPSKDYHLFWEQLAKVVDSDPETLSLSDDLDKTYKRFSVCTEFETSIKQRLQSWCCWFAKPKAQGEQALLLQVVDPEAKNQQFSQV